MSESTLSRRDFIKYASLVGGGLLVIKLARDGRISSLEPRNATASDPVSEAQSKHHWVMVIDQSKCIGCNYCTYACKATNDIPGKAQWNTVSVEAQMNKGPVYLPRPCMHCENAPCVEACPVKATYHRADGLVTTDYDKCIGCKACISACPYESRTYIEKEKFYFPNTPIPYGVNELRGYEGVVQKCTFCVDMVKEGQQPACVEVCPPSCRTFGDLDDPESEVCQVIRTKNAFLLLPDKGTDPSVYYTR